MLEEIKMQWGAFYLSLLLMHRRVAQWERALVARLNDLSFILRTGVMEGKS